MLAIMWRNRITHPFLVGKSICIGTLENNRPVPYKSQYVVTQRQHLHSCAFIPDNDNLCSNNNLFEPMNVHSSFSSIAQNWKQLKCSSASEQLNKLWYIHTTEFYSAL